MNVLVIGAGYVGLVTGVCFAIRGHNVTCLDADSRKVAALQRGKVPIYEPGLETSLHQALQLGTISFTDQPNDSTWSSEIILISVDTPSDHRGACDLSKIEQVAEQIGKQITTNACVVLKSTAPIGTCKHIHQIVTQNLAERGLAHLSVDVASNPEFLKEGSAVSDFTDPDRVIIGVDRPATAQKLVQLYAPFPWAGERLLITDIASSEMIKYASNAMLATRISFMNEIAELCETCDADIEEVRRGMSADRRIGPEFLRVGIGFGGSCLPKDLRALAGMSSKAGINAQLIETVSRINVSRPEKFARKIEAYFESFGGIAGRELAIWGLTFKANTDDMRESPTLPIIEHLQRAGAQLRLFDPIATKNAQAALSQSGVGSVNIRWCESAELAAQSADGIVLLTDWPEFLRLDFHRIKDQMEHLAIFDGRNQLAHASANLQKLGFDYLRIGKTPNLSETEVPYSKLGKVLTS